MGLWITDRNQHFLFVESQSFNHKLRRYFYFYVYVDTAKTAIAVWSQGVNFRCSLCTVSAYLHGPLGAALVSIYSCNSWFCQSVCWCHGYFCSLWDQFLCLDEMARPLDAALPVFAMYLMRLICWRSIHFIPAPYLIYPLGRQILPWFRRTNATATPWVLGPQP